MKALVVYYSESGNTRKLAQAVAAGLGVAAVKLEDAAPLKLADYDLICLGTPVQGGAPAKKVLDFISQMPAMSGKKAAAFCTMHMFGSKNALRQMQKAFEARGMDYLGGYSALGWSRLVANFGPRIFNRGRPGADELKRAEEFGKNLAAKTGQPAVACI